MRTVEGMRWWLTQQTVALSGLRGVDGQHMPLKIEGTMMASNFRYVLLCSSLHA
jgi:hypothetical protein